MNARNTFAAIMAALPLCAGLATASTITVPDDYSTIGAAIAAAVSGDRIYIKRGTYDAPQGGWKINKSLEIFGDGVGSFGGMGAGTVLRPYLGNQLDSVLVISFSNVTDGYLPNIYIHDLAISRNGSPSANSNSNGIICLTPGNGEKALVSLRLARIEISNMGNDGIHLDGVNAGAGALQGVSIEDCTSHFNGRKGLYVRHAQMLRVDGGIYSNNQREGIELEDCVAPVVTAVELGGNQLASPVGEETHSSLFLEGSSGFFVTGGHFEDWHGGGGRTAVGIAGCRGGYIGGCSFGNATASDSRGIHIYSSHDIGITVGVNKWSRVDVLVEIDNESTITSCLVEPQAVQDTTDADSKIIAPEIADRGHVIFAPTRSGSTVTAGLALPGVSSASRDGMTAAASGGTRREGLVIYNADRKGFQLWNGSRWIEGVTTYSGIDTSFTSAKDTTRILTAPAPGVYQVSIYARTTGQSGNPSEAVEISWYEGGARRTLAKTLLKNDLLNTEYPIYLSGGHLNYAVTGSTFSGTAAVRIRVVPLQ